MKICRKYRNSVVPAPFLVMAGDLPQPVGLVVDRLGRDIFIATFPTGGAEVLEEQELLVFPWSPYLTVRGIDQAFEYPGVLEGLAGAIKGDKESISYIFETLGNPYFFEPLDSVTAMRPCDYFEIHPPALLERIVLDPVITYLDLQEALWT